VVGWLDGTAGLVGEKAAVVGRGKKSFDCRRL
jgi:hypothetical protein